MPTVTIALQADLIPAKPGTAPARAVPYHEKPRWGGSRKEAAEARKLPFHARNLEILEEFIRSLPSLSERRIMKYRTRMGKCGPDRTAPFPEDGSTTLADAVHQRRTALLAELEGFAASLWHGERPERAI